MSHSINITTSNCLSIRHQWFGSKFHTMSARNPQRISSIDSTFPSDSRDLVSVIVLPTRSDCAELAGMHSTRRATCDSTANSLASVSTTLVASMNSAHIKIFNLCVSAVSDPCTTQPNPPKFKKSRPNPIQPNPTQPNPWVDPTHGQLCSDVAYNCDEQIGGRQTDRTAVACTPFSKGVDREDSRSIISTCRTLT